MPGGTEIIFGVARVGTECSPTTPITLSAGPRDTQTHRGHVWGRACEDRMLTDNPNHTLGRTEGRSDPPRSCLGSYAWGPAAAWEPRFWFQRGLGVPGGTEIIFRVVRERTEYSPTTPITLSAGPRDTQTHRDHIWGRTHGDHILSNNPDYGFGESWGCQVAPRSCLGLFGPCPRKTRHRSCRRVRRSPSQVSPKRSKMPHALPDISGSDLKSNTERAQVGGFK